MSKEEIVEATKAIQLLVETYLSQVNCTRAGGLVDKIDIDVHYDGEPESTWHDVYNEHRATTCPPLDAVLYLTSHILAEEARQPAG